MPTNQELAAAMQADLERRVAEISAADGAFERIGAVELALVAVGALVVPLGLWWWFG